MSTVPVHHLLIIKNNLLAYPCVVFVSHNVYPTFLYVLLTSRQSFISTCSIYTKTSGTLDACAILYLVIVNTYLKCFEVM